MGRVEKGPKKDHKKAGCAGCDVCGDCNPDHLYALTKDGTFCAKHFREYERARRRPWERRAA